ncbi:MAG: hypothetical protein AMXMBFR45_16560 [Gammaproteobacteria bacterium]|nr:MAG: DUF4136 domain-containing protein [Pseudomonadota bacterium]MBC6944294.1 DUF4136 domain-containing protein [Gammaproteobacteria bacterium]MCE7896234.1 DUF4136 domain-containing protein [Gammaproteobacteria bacterium PRO8]MDL1879449.1 DUF4136 domain-containing protein [Gammaproteobacteria bacterium PRO2]MCL4777627.1 DUF4136 domain-containing protein [Gammaproteobacteria bacterium]
MRLESGIRALCTLLLTVLAGCASGPSIRVDGDPSVNFGAYRSFGFFEPLATDKAGYSTLLTARLKDAARREMTAKGYVYDEANPELRLNFNVNLVDKTEIRSSPSVGAGYGYYGYRHGLYGAWGGYPYDVETTNYKQGTLTIDVVDAVRKALVWQGVAEARITQKIRENPAGAVDAAVTQILAGFPAHGAVAATPAKN